MLFTEFCLPDVHISTTFHDLEFSEVANDSQTPRSSSPPYQNSTDWEAVLSYLNLKWAHFETYYCNPKFQAIIKIL